MQSGLPIRGLKGLSSGKYLLAKKYVMIGSLLLLGSIGVKLFNLVALEVLSIGIWAIGMLFFIKALLLFLLVS